MKRMNAIVITCVLLLTNLAIISAVGEEASIEKNDEEIGDILFSVTSSRGSIGITVINGYNATMNYSLVYINMRYIIRASILQRVFKNYNPIEPRDFVTENGTISPNGELGTTIPITTFKLAPIMVMIVVGNETTGKYIWNMGYVSLRRARFTSSQTGDAILEL